MKTLIIAEKPSVARDIVGALPGSFDEHKNFYESDDYVVTFAVGHLLELSDPEDYDPAWKSWKLDNLPIIPDEFKVRPRDKKSATQLNLIHKLLKRKDVDRVVNACDAGREGELIFTHIYETSETGKPVDRLWINSMTKAAIRDGFEKLRPADQLEPLRDAARSRSEADWLVGMNATRAATTRRGWGAGVVSLGRVQTPTLAMMVKREREIQAFTPEPYWLVHAPPEGESRVIDRSNQYGDLELDARTVILKIHGAVDRTDRMRDSYVVTEDDYIDYLTHEDVRNLIPITLVQKLQESHFLFLGYSMRDWNLRVILRRIWHEQTLNWESWAVQRTPKEIERKFWGRHGVEILDVRLEEYVEGLRAALHDCAPDPSP